VIATLAAVAPWKAPTIDYHALLPEIILAVGLVVVLLVDLFLEERGKWLLSSLASFSFLGAFVPVVTLALSDSGARSMFDGRFVVDDFSLVLKGLFILVGYVVVLLSTTYVEEGDYYRGEYWVMMLTSVLGMVMMASSRDLVSIFVALEFLSIPAYMLAAWRKRDSRSNEAGAKYFLLGVFASAVMLYGMSLVYGATGSTLLVDIGASLDDSRRCTNTSDCLLVCCLKGGRIRGFGNAYLHCVPVGFGCLAADDLGSCSPHNDCRQCDCTQADQHRANACVFVNQPRWFHLDASRGGGHK
jgi:NADH-quinone oxidoreductase subunit N